MSCERITRFLCEGCGKVALVDDYKLPKGFVWIPQRIGVREKIEHRCGDCVKTVMEKNNGVFDVDFL